MGDETIARRGFLKGAGAAGTAVTLGGGRADEARAQAAPPPQRGQASGNDAR
jgi:hypothetical protein